VLIERAANAITAYEWIVNPPDLSSLHVHNIESRPDWNIAWERFTVARFVELSDLWRSSVRTVVDHEPQLALLSAADPLQTIRLLAEEELRLTISALTLVDLVAILRLAASNYFHEIESLLDRNRLSHLLHSNLHSWDHELLPRLLHHV
jgi:hypothetical protein